MPKDKKPKDVELLEVVREKKKDQQIDSSSDAELLEIVKDDDEQRVEIVRDDNNNLHLEVEYLEVVREPNESAEEDVSDKKVPAKSKQNKNVKSGMDILLEKYEEQDERAERERENSKRVDEKYANNDEESVSDEEEKEEALATSIIVKKLCSDYQKHLQKEKIKYLEKNLVNDLIKFIERGSEPNDAKLASLKQIKSYPKLQKLNRELALEYQLLACAQLFGFLAKDGKKEFLQKEFLRFFLKTVHGTSAFKDSEKKPIVSSTNNYGLLLAKEEKMKKIEKLMAKKLPLSERIKNINDYLNHKNSKIKNVLTPLEILNTRRDGRFARFWQAIDNIRGFILGKEKSTTGVTGAHTIKNMFTHFKTYSESKEVTNDKSENAPTARREKKRN